MPLPLAGAVGAGLGLLKTVLGRVLPNMTEREKLTREEQKQEIEARDRKANVKARDPSDSLGDGSF